MASIDTDRMATIRGAGAAEPCDGCDVRSLAVCSGLKPDELERLEAIKSTVRYRAGDICVQEGDAAAHLFNVTAGAIKVYKLLADGRRQITGFLFAGDFLGLTLNDTYAYSAEAVTNVALCRFQRPRFEALLAEFPKLEKRLLGVASSELAAAQDQMLLLGRKTAREKVASFLLQLQRRTAQVGDSSGMVDLPMSRTDIADYLGLTTETVSRTITQLKTAGIVRLQGQGRIALARHETLRQMAEGFDPAG